MILNNLLIFTVLGGLALFHLSNRWQMRLASLAILYLCQFLIVVQIWPLALASIKLIAGLMGITLLSSIYLNYALGHPSRSHQSEKIFQLLLAIMFWIVFFATTNRINNWLPIEFTNLYVGLVIIGSGLVVIAFQQDIHRMILGLLLVLNGFDIIYSSLEGSALVTGIYATIQLSLAVLSGYFFYQSHDEGRQ